MPGISSGLIGVAENFEQRRAGLAAEAFGLRQPSDDVLNQRLGHARVDAVMRHVIADAVGAPSERQLAQVAGADHQPAVEIGQAEQMAGALARLHVLEGDVVNALCPRRTDGRCP